MPDFGTDNAKCLVLSCLAFVPVGVSAQSGMRRVEAAQLRSAAGFPILDDQPVNRCGNPAKPPVAFVDIDGDKRPETLFVDADAARYAGSGRYLALLGKEAANWRSVINGTGSIQALPSNTAGSLVSKLANGSWRLITHGTGTPEFRKSDGADGWPDVSIGGPGFCFPVEWWNGREYQVQRWENDGGACKPPR